MSHFSVMIIGDNPEEQLSPYDENLVSPHHELEKYRLLFKGDGEKGSFASYLKDNFGFLQIGQSNPIPNRSYFVADGARVVDVVVFYNPDAKWDWYRLGGIWDDRLLLKTQKRANQAPKKDIDFESMMQTSIENCVKRYDGVRKRIEPHLGEKYLNFAQMRKLEPNIEKARSKYFQQPIVQAFQETNLFFDNIEDYFVPKDEYFEQHKFDDFSTFAFLKNGAWHEEGTMGWWGVVSNPDASWSTRFVELFNSVGDDEIVSIYDLHI